MGNKRIERSATGWVVVRSVLVMFATAVLLSGCVAGKWVAVRMAPKRNGAPVVVEGATAVVGEQLALEAQVREEIYDGEQLGVTVELKTHEEIDASVVAVRLRLLRGGEVVSDSLLPLPSILATQVLDADKEYLVPLVGHAANLTDYQVELVWGGEAVDLLKTQTTKDLLVTVKEVEKEQVCEGTQCSDSYRLKALLEVTNSGKMPCGKVSLKVHLSVPGVQSAAKVVRFESFNLKPGTTTLIRLNFQDILKKDQEATPEISVQECF
jgi:hypothetical protein